MRRFLSLVSTSALITALMACSETQLGARVQPQSANAEKPEQYKASSDGADDIGVGDDGEANPSNGDDGKGDTDGSSDGKGDTDGSSDGKGDDGDTDIGGDDGSSGTDDVTDDDDDVSKRGCKYTDKNHPDNAKYRLPAPLYVVEGIAVPAVLAAAALVPEYTPCLLSGGPSIQIADYVKDGSWSGDKLKFSLTAYKSMDAAGAFCTGWTYTKPGSTFLVEAEWKVTVKNAKSSSCTVSAEAIPVTRGKVAGKPDGCFDGKSEILMADGTTMKASVISLGDRVYSPLDGKAYAVREVIKGPEHDLGMIEVGVGGKVTVVTAKHPFMTPSGLKAARDLTKADKIVTASGAFAPVTHLRVRAPNDAQTVYNFVLDAADDALNSHLVVADGVVSGDLHLQRVLEKQAPAKPMVATNGL